MKHRTHLATALTLAISIAAPVALAACGDDEDTAHTATTVAPVTDVTTADPAGGSTTPTLTADERQAIVDATTAYQDIDAAIAAGFQPTESCAAMPGVGAMGYHYVNPAHMADGVIDPAKPEILLFHTDADGALRLGGVEYFAADADQDLATDADRPFLHGHPFDGPMEAHEPGMPTRYDLHGWRYAANPTGPVG
eukprot:gene20695-40556_t